MASFSLLVALTIFSSQPAAASPPIFEPTFGAIHSQHLQSAAHHRQAFAEEALDLPLTHGLLILGSIALMTIHQRISKR